ncbi:alpha-mannosyltransferase KNAG_0D03070 [Huiozyma naganishii CBS 8797]|uniref:Alpha-1,3-mannosyltransferase n=1 Tax=Huiozyma naganishii (strain ATCC MYA-139 / BCRC 22969 / CBS 8797 / KCTC 17520 / NBRC 10181 / NCYC 3082 / Yp74L-3) TaxID=1071383 RepID=J7R5D9_HUIN7|nr:hypothetical protein KNAG_0D03070 [Kazachstania naganishii CBS 8797]CCK70055.1 hypothetical protein KNAG_0D03070 [Kazachstania naganishii CBS 8797]
MVVIVGGRRNALRVLFFVSAALVLVTLVRVHSDARSRNNNKVKHKFKLAPVDPASPDATYNYASQSSKPAAIYKAVPKPETRAEIKDKYKRPLFPNSPFTYVMDIYHKAAAELKDKKQGISLFKGKANDKSKIFNWWETGDLDRVEKCKILLDALYHEDPEWSNQVFLTGFKNDGDTFKYSALGTERFRIYDYCFLSGGLDIGDVLKGSKKYDALDFQHRMFPYLKVPKLGEVLLPKITDLSTMAELSFITSDFDSKRHNENFWKSWREMSDGKGIITTFNPKAHGDYFLRQLKILQYQKNTLPIQILVRDGDFSDSFVRKLADAARRTNQKIYLVNYTAILDKSNMGEFKSYINKLAANLFNTFEEFILLDADAVPYFPLESYLELPDYQKTGMYMFRDRILDHRIDDACTTTLEHLEPSMEEAVLLGTSIMYTVSSNVVPTTPEEKVYVGMVREHIRENVETGLVVVDKKNKLPGLLMALALNLSKKLNACMYGEKEFYWLGPYFSGMSYSIEAKGAALTGFPEKMYDGFQYVNTKLCDFHIAHVRGKELSWINGGLREFKPGSGGQDEGYENKPWRMNGLLIPDEKLNEWVQTKAGFGLTYCATAIEVGSDQSPSGEVIWFDEKTYNKINDISKLWNEDGDLTFEDK